MGYSFTFRPGDEELVRLAHPLIVLTGNGNEYDDFLEASGRPREMAVAITSAHQFDFYPGLRVCHYGTYWLNPAFETTQYHDRLRELLEEDFENEGNS